MACSRAGSGLGVQVRGDGSREPLTCWGKDSDPSAKPSTGLEHSQLLLGRKMTGHLVGGLAALTSLPSFKTRSSTFKKPSWIDGRRMDSLASTSVSGLIGHSSKGPRTEPHWSELGHLPLHPRTNQFLSLGEGGSVWPGLVHPQGLRQVWGGLPKENQGVVSGRRESRCWAGRRNSEPQRPQTRISLCPFQNHKALRDHRFISILRSGRVRAL